MKTEIFKDLVPLKDMSFKEIDQLAIDISKENKDIESYIKLIPLIASIDYFLKKIKIELHK